MTTKKLGRGLGMVTIVLAVVGIPVVSASADTNGCYPTCSTTTTLGSGSGGGTGGGGSTSGGGGNTSSGSGSGTLPPITKSAGGSGSSGSAGSGATTVSTKAAGGGLPFTGADVEELTIGGVGALLIGAGLLRRSRNRRRAGA